LSDMAGAEESNLETRVREKWLPSRLLTLDCRLDDLHAQAAASGAATMEFAEAAIQRIAGLEAEVLQLSCGSQLHRQHLFSPPQRAESESFTETWISQPARQVALQSMETAISRLASVEQRCVAAEREAREAVDAAHGAAQMLTQLEAHVRATDELLESRVCQLEVNSRLKSCEAAGGRMPELQHDVICADAKTIAVVEERVCEGVSQCVGLVDAVRGLAGSGGLDALRDLVEAIESVASRVTTLEQLTDGHACHAQPTHAVSSDLLERINLIERHMAEIHDQLSESLLTLWSAVREISRELSGAGGDSGTQVSIDRPETPQQQQPRWFGQSQVTPPLLPSFEPAHVSQRRLGDGHACQL